MMFPVAQAPGFADPAQGGDSAGSHMVACAGSAAAPGSGARLSASGTVQYR